MIRFRAAAVIGATGILAAGLFAVPAQAEDDEWTQYRNGPTKNAVITTDADEIFTGEIPTANEVRATPVIASGSIFVGNHETGELQAFDLESGEELWQSRAANWVHSEMLYHDGRLYVGFGNRFYQDDGVRGTGENGVLALDASSGEELWKYNTDGEVMPTPALIDDSLYAVTGDRHLYELDPDTGDERHVEETGHMVSMSSPGVEGDMLYFGGGKPDPYTFLAYDTSRDEFAWHTEFDDIKSGLDDVPPAIAENVVVTGAQRGIPKDSSDQAREEHVIIAMAADTGEVLWQHDIGIGATPTNNRSGAPMIHDGTVFIGSPTTEQAYAYDLQTGKQEWNAHTGAIKGAPTAQDGVVYFSTTDGDVHAFDTEDGESVGSLELEGALAPAGPVIVDDHLLVPSQSAHVYSTPLSEIRDSDSPWRWVVGGALVVLIGVRIALLLRRSRNRRRDS